MSFLAIFYFFKMFLEKIKRKKRPKTKKVRVKKALKFINILNIRMNSTELAEVLKFAQRKIKQGERFFIVTPNPEIVMQASSDPVLSSILNSADISLPDGVGLVWASRLQARPTLFSKTLGTLLGVIDGFFQAPRLISLKTPTLKENKKPTSRSFALHFSKRLASPYLVTERISGVDVMEALVRLAAKHGWRVFLLGGKPGVAEAAAKNLKNKLEIGKWKMEIQADSGPWLDNNGKPLNKNEKIKEDEVIKRISLFSPHLLFVGFGAPKQEKWVRSNYNKIETLGTMVVGGAFDYISGRIPRAPLFVRKIGFEWLFRLIVEPWRWKRQLALLRFLWRVLTHTTT